MPELSLPAVRSDDVLQARTADAMAMWKAVDNRCANRMCYILKCYGVGICAFVEKWPSGADIQMSTRKEAISGLINI